MSTRGKIGFLDNLLVPQPVHGFVSYYFILGTFLAISAVTIPVGTAMIPYPKIMTKRQ
jgi:hypothetical protein